MKKNALLIFLIVIFVFNPAVFLAQKVQAPETLEEAKSMGERIIWDFPGVMREVWQEALQIWKNFWSSYVRPVFSVIWQKIKSLLGKEVEQRRPGVEEELEKEKQEMKEEIPKAGKSLWQRLKELIK